MSGGEGPWESCAPTELLSPARDGPRQLGHVHGGRSGRLHGGGKAPGGDEAGDGWYGFGETTRRWWWCWLGVGSTGAGNSGGGKELRPAMAAMASTAVLSASRLQKASEGVGMERAGGQGSGSASLERHVMARW